MEPESASDTAASTQLQESVTSSPARKNEAYESIPPSGYSTPHDFVPAKPLDLMQALKCYKELADADRLETQIAKGEQKRTRRNEIQQLLDAKLGECKQDPQQHFCTTYGTGGSTSRGRVYTKDDD
ncbi:hypothetical protein GGH96_002462 [Coemansia sp. RSA 1972]|nr:hypothetical protein GGH96_002462 [Coemansia sp. RSA 1972]